MEVTAWVQQSVPEAAVNRAQSSSLVNAPYSLEGTTAAVPLSYCIHSSLGLQSHKVPGLDEMRCNQSGGKHHRESQIIHKNKKIFLWSSNLGSQMSLCFDEKPAGIYQGSRSSWCKSTQKKMLLWRSTHINYLQFNEWKALAYSNSMCIRNTAEGNVSNGKSTCAFPIKKILHSITLVVFWM